MSCPTWVLSVEGNNKPVDAEFLPLDTACEEHTCPWNFAEGRRDLGPSNLQLRNANGLSILSGRNVMVSHDVLGLGGRVILHAKLPLCRATSKGLFSVLESSRRVARKSSSETRTHGLTFTCACASERQDFRPLDPED